MLRQIPLLLILFLALLFWLDHHLRKASYATHEDFVRSSSSLVVSALRSSARTEYGHKAWEEIGRRITANEGISFEIMDLKGKVVGGSDQTAKGTTYQLGDPMCAACHTDGSKKGKGQTAFFKNPQGESYQMLKAPLENDRNCIECHRKNGPKLGMVLVRHSLGPIRSLIHSTQVGIILAGAIAFILTILTTRLFLGRYLDQPLKRLVAGVKAIGSGDLDTRINLPQQTELTILANAFNRSAEQLRETVGKVQDQRDDLMAMYEVAERLSHAVQPGQRLQRLVELAEEIFRSECALVAGNVNPDTLGTKGTITFRDKNKQIVEKPFADQDWRSVIPFYSPLVMDKWLGGKYDGWNDRVREGGTIAYPVEHNKKRMGIVLTIPPKDEDKSAKGRVIGSNPKVVRAFCRQLAIAIEFSQLQQEFVRQERLAAIGETVAGLAHCLKNTLNGLRGGQYVMESAMKNDDPQKLQQGWRVMQDGVRHIERLSLDMLYYAGERKLQLTPANPNAIMQEVLDLLKDTASGQDVSLAKEFDAQTPELRMDRTAIFRAVLNLASNAIDACVESEKGNTVTLKTIHRPDDVMLVVEDDGIGMSEATLSHVFERFYTTKSAKGTGLGLPVVRKIAEEHGGILKVESALGEGSTFCIILPYKPEKPA